ncbi:ABC transporter ATP-binding protein [Geminicoccaceae bacterium 1502E]|nr:ABC transporter ATP-binding protein [Geminicoccaceae bacterium 1502E]
MSAPLKTQAGSPDRSGDDRPVLEIEGLRIALPKGADRPFALDGLDLTVRAGEIVCLVGESGSGKSMAAGAITRLLPEPHVRVTGGTVRFEGQDIASLTERQMRALRGDRMAMIFQEPMTALNPQKTVGWQIDEVLRLHTSMSRAERRARCLEILEQVKIPEPASAMNAYPHQISGGQRQRVMIAMALVLQPRLIIADEPTTALDVTTQLQILKLIRELQETLGTGVLFITHDFGVVAEIADRVAVLRQGELVEQGPAAEVLNRPQHPYTRALIAAVPALRPPEPKPLADAPVVLEAKGLVKTFAAKGGLFGARRKAVAAVKNLSFELRRGETLGVVGESGSGKTTVSRCVTRLLESDAGSIRLGETDILAASRRELRALRSEIQMVFQDPMASLNPRKRVVDLIAQGPIVHGTPPAEARARARELLELVELSPAAAERFPHEFSGGQRQRIGIARALAMNPRVIVADEPVSALDVSVQAQVLRLLADLRDRLHLSLLFVTHDLRVAAQLCDRVIVMERGEIVETGPTAEVFANPRHPYTRTLLGSIPGRDWTPPIMQEDAA